ncbi:hypothetical protein SEPCBS57363_003177 [Sporothrix epigloea]|uniref:Uncharacterized protein n=1 Tax=Sporothrix epigloea TaxID=1892477 RepID=A0ABP0DLT4_9PEZI
MALDQVLKDISKGKESFEVLVDIFLNKSSAASVALAYYARPGLFTIVREDKTRGGQPLHDFLEILQRAEYGDSHKCNETMPPVSPISSKAFTVPPEDGLCSECNELFWLAARRSCKFLKRILKLLAKKLRL